MITYLKKDLRTVTRGVIAHGCNTKGVMASGVAAALRKKWPKIFDTYQMLCRSPNSEDLLGTAHCVSIKNEELIIANLFTQLNYGKDGKRYASPEAIASALGYAAHYAFFLNLPLYMPKIGCGLGGLDWNMDVKSIVEAIDEEYSRDDVELTIFVCEI